MCCTTDSVRFKRRMKIEIERLKEMFDYFLDRFLFRILIDLKR
jgi:hypothetical protein